MRRALILLLTAALLFGMIPATVLNAFANGYGVGRDETENQSKYHATGQYIPETIKVDGVFNDTGWDKDGWYDVSTNTGVWNSRTPSSTNADLTYKYQLRADYNYFYAAAFVYMPEGVTNGSFTIYISDVHPYDEATKNQRGITAGFTFEIKDGKFADTPAASLGLDDLKDGYADGKAVLSSDYLFEKGVADDGSLYFEFRNRAEDTYDTERTQYPDIYYYVSVDLPVTADGATESLYHPIFSLENASWENSVTAEFWPEGGIELEFLDDANNDTTLPGAVKVDGKFNESLWAGFTGFYEGADKNIVEYKDAVLEGAVGTNLVNLNTVKYNDKTADHVYYGDGNKTKYDIPKAHQQKFKCDIRADENNLYGAIYIYAYDALETQVILRIFNENNARTHQIYFHFLQNDVLSYYGYRSKTPVLQGGSYKEENGEKITQYISCGMTKQDDDLFTVEFKIPLEVVDYDEENILFQATNNNESYKVTGSDNDTKNRDGIYYSITTGRASKTLKASSGNAAVDYASIGILNDKHQKDPDLATRVKLDSNNPEYLAGDKTAPYYVGSASESVNPDGILDEDVWTVISGADNTFDGSYRHSSTSTSDRTLIEKNIYRIAADHEYLYGAAIVKLVNGKTWSANEEFRLWFNVNGDTTGERHVIDFKIGKDNAEYTRDFGTSFTVQNDIAVDAYTGTLKGGNIFILEFKINLKDFGIEPLITASGDKILLSYYVTAGTAGSGSNDRTVIAHPMQGLYDGRFDAGRNNTYYKYAKKLYYKDLVDTVKIDGNVDELVWDKLHGANLSNSTVSIMPYEASTFAYDYNVYIGNNYLYGAIILDCEADDSTEFNVWLDNHVDERAWMSTSYPVILEYDFYDYTTTHDKYTGELGSDGKGVTSGEKEEITVKRTRYYINHKYTFKATGDSVATPNWYNTDRTNNSSTSVKIENGKNYSYSMTTVNGKTYLEFMIDLDNFHYTRAKGARYYISVTHKPTGENNTITMTSPKVSENTMFWYTHHNNGANVEAAGVIFTQNLSVYTSQAMNYWLHMAFKPTADANDGNSYELVEIVDLNGKKGDKYHPDLPTGGFIYAVNGGTAYPVHSSKPSDATNVEANGLNKYFIDTRNPRAYECMQAIRQWNVGDVIKFSFDPMNESALTAYCNKNAIYVTTDGAGDRNTMGNIVEIKQKAVPGNTNNTSYTTGDNVSNIGYYSSFEATRVKKGAETLAEEERFIRLEPSLTEADHFTLDGDGNPQHLMYGTANVLKKLQHFAPDAIVVDGSLGDTGWDVNGWTDVTEKNSSGYGDAVKYKYQLRTDDTYLYVGALIDSAYADGTAFRIWLNGDNSDYYTSFYELAYGKSNVEVVQGAVSHDEFAETLNHEGANGMALSDFVLTYNNTITSANNANQKIDFFKYTTKGYGESAMFGYTKEIEENIVSGIWDWEARPCTYGFRYGIECGVIKSADGVRINSESGTEDQTVVEFKVELADFGGADGFGYFVQAYDADGSSVFPALHSEVSSEENYYAYSYPEWAWCKDREITVSKADVLPCGTLWLRNEYAPIVTLGAKTAETYGEHGKTIRFGMLYNEEFIRKTNVVDGTDYWDVAEMGLICIPNVLLGGKELTLETSSIKSFDADAILDWISNTPDGKTNFADYENFVFYASIWDVPETIDMAFRGYIDYYNVNGSDVYYSQTFVRSYSMVQQSANESADGVLPG